MRRTVPIRSPVTADHIIGLEDGWRLATLRRHLRDAFGLTPGPMASAGACGR
ncbi:MucR family transcriptional regulator [Teichococcus deserti]|uniref:MucR family transcriptional regulator n=1 Tax=Teichococcus deserti TaxID=1817963 RepID=UPI0009F8AB75|nr:MucR family transcriptional regulator [Pseudoroseomonas deserti]